jgi:hypothetical protein
MLVVTTSAPAVPDIDTMFIPALPKLSESLMRSSVAGQRFGSITQS